jgi:hypothetical protein
MGRFPPALVRRRIDVHLGDFFDWLAAYYRDHGRELGDVRREPDAWLSRDLTIRIGRSAADGRVRELTVQWRNVPSAIAHTHDAVEIGFEHDYSVILPADYPTDLRMRFVNLTPTIHPRMMPPERHAPACIFPNGELDAVLRELLFNLLFEPAHVRTPSDFAGEDRGFRPTEMTWLERYGAKRLHEELLAAWARRSAELAPEPPPCPAPEAPAAPPVAQRDLPFAIRATDEPEPDDGEPPPSGFTIRDL